MKSRGITMARLFFSAILFFSASAAWGGVSQTAAFDHCLDSIAFQANVPYRTDATFSASNQKLLNSAQTSIDKGDFIKAVKSLQRLEKRNLNDFERALVFFLYGQIAAAEGNYEEALSQHERISALDQNQLPVVFEREVDATALQLHLKVSSIDEIVGAALSWCAKSVTDKATAKRFLLSLYGQLGFEAEVAALNAVVPSGDYMPLFKVAPEYPKYAQERGIGGYCVIEYVVTATGSVRDPAVVEGLCDPESIFAEPSIEAALQFKYSPYLVDGEPVDVPGVQNKFIYEIEPW